MVETQNMDLPLHPRPPLSPVPGARPLLLQLLLDGVPPTLLLDLLDPDGMRAALAGELAASDAAPEQARSDRRARLTA